jgi:hypothetical protein
MNGGGAKRTSFENIFKYGHIQNMFQIWAKNKKKSQEATVLGRRLADYQDPWIPVVGTEREKRKRGDGKAA